MTSSVEPVGLQAESSAEVVHDVDRIATHEGLRSADASPGGSSMVEHDSCRLDQLTVRETSIRERIPRALGARIDSGVSWLQGSDRMPRHPTQPVAQDAQFGNERPIPDTTRSIGQSSGPNQRDQDSPGRRSQPVADQAAASAWSPLYSEPVSALPDVGPYLNPGARLVDLLPVHPTCTDRRHRKLASFGSWTEHAKPTHPMKLFPLQGGTRLIAWLFIAPTRRPSLPLRMAARTSANAARMGSERIA